MKELNSKENGDKFVPTLYDVFVHEQPNNLKGERGRKMSVFLIMEYFEMDMKQFIQNKAKDLDEQKVM